MVCSSSFDLPSQMFLDGVFIPFHPFTAAASPLYDMIKKFVSLLMGTVSWLSVSLFSCQRIVRTCTPCLLGCNRCCNALRAAFGHQPVPSMNRLATYACPMASSPNATEQHAPDSRLRYPSRLRLCIAPAVWLGRPLGQSAPCICSLWSLPP